MSPSPLLYDDTIYYLRHYQNILTRRSAKTGAEDHGPFRLPGVLNLYASPVAAAGRIYLTDQQGSTVVIDHQNPKPLALNTLDEGTNASSQSSARISLSEEHNIYTAYAKLRISLQKSGPVPNFS